jgi:hypothetical protein
MVFIFFLWHFAVLFALMRKEPKGSGQKQPFNCAQDFHCFCPAHAQGNTPVL